MELDALVPIEAVGDEARCEDESGCDGPRRLLGHGRPLEERPDPDDGGPGGPDHQSGQAGLEGPQTQQEEQAGLEGEEEPRGRDEGEEAEVASGECVEGRADDPGDRDARAQGQADGRAAGDRGCRRRGQDAGYPNTCSPPRRPFSSHLGGYDRTSELIYSGRNRYPPGMTRRTNSSVTDRPGGMAA